MASSPLRGNTHAHTRTHTSNAVAICLPTTEFGTRKQMSSRPRDNQQQHTLSFCIPFHSSHTNTHNPMRSGNSLREPIIVFGLRRWRDEQTQTQTHSASDMNFLACECSVRSLATQRRKHRYESGIGALKQMIGFISFI